MASPQQPRQPAGIPIGVRDESDAVAGAFHVQILPEHVLVDAAKLDLGAELGLDQIVQAGLRKAEQLEWKTGIDLLDAHFARAAFLLRDSTRARFGLDAMLNETRGNIRTRS